MAKSQNHSIPSYSSLLAFLLHPDTDSIYFIRLHTVQKEISQSLKKDYIFILDSANHVFFFRTIKTLSCMCHTTTAHFLPKNPKPREQYNKTQRLKNAYIPSPIDCECIYYLYLYFFCLIFRLAFLGSRCCWCSCA